MDILKRFKKRLILLLVICVIASLGFVKKEINKTVSAWSEPLMLKTVILDAGHGGFDGGAGAADGTREKDINLQIAKKTRDFLVFSGFNVIMTRTDDSGTEDNSGESIASRKKSDLKNRLELMETAGEGVYVSIHLNKFTTSAASGTQVFYTPNFESAKALGESIQRTVVTRLQPENRRVVKRGNDSTYLLKNAKIPAVIVECGFLSNSGDLKNLKNEAYQQKMAFCIALGIITYYG